MPPPPRPGPRRNPHLPSTWAKGWVGLHVPIGQEGGPPSGGYLRQPFRGNPRCWPAFPVASPLRPPKARTHMGTETVKRCGDGGEKGRGTADDTKEERFGMFAARPAVAKVAGAGLGAAGTRIPACLPRWGTRTGPACHHAGGQSHGRGPMPALGPWELKDPPFGPVGARGRGPLVAWGGARLARGRPGGV